MITIKFIETLRKEANGIKYTRDTFEVGYYTIYENTTVFANGSIYRSLDLFPVKDRAKAVGFEGWEYLPEIYFNRGLFSSKNPAKEKFDIQTTSYGSLEIPEFKKFMAAMNHALEVAQAVTDKYVK